VDHVAYSNVRADAVAHQHIHTTTQSRQAAMVRI
jgi:hypothetical protein